jgi:hypothetical protein
LISETLYGQLFQFSGQEVIGDGHLRYIGHAHAVFDRFFDCFRIGKFRDDGQISYVEVLVFFQADSNCFVCLNQFLWL